MRCSAVPVGMMFIIGLVSGCSKTDVAEVVDRGNSFYGRDGVVALSAVPGAPVEEGTYQSAVTLPVEAKDLTKPSFTTVQEGKSTAAASPALPTPPVAMNASWQWPVNGTVTATFGQTVGGVKNEGIIIAAPEGTPIRAAQAGEVIYIGNDAKIYGNVVILRHASGDMTSYAHAKTISVAKGQKVDAGATLGFVGHTGNVTAPVLHFAMREKGVSVDPLKKLPHQMALN